MFNWLIELFSLGGDGPSTEKKSCKCADKGFVDPETGKVYKTAGSLKAAQTRRKNKGKKKTKK